MYFNHCCCIGGNILVIFMWKFFSLFLQFVGTITKIMKLENTIVHVIDISVLVPPAILTYE